MHPLMTVNPRWGGMAGVQALATPPRGLQKTTGRRGTVVNAYTRHHLANRMGPVFLG
jgi:hypothetical protein